MESRKKKWIQKKAESRGERKQQEEKKGGDLGECRDNMEWKCDELKQGAAG